MKGFRGVLTAALIAAVAGACGGPVDPNAVQDADALTIAVPARMAGLKVSLSKTATRRYNREASGSDSYVRNAQVFALRSKGELRAVFQVLRLSPDARTDEFEFRRTIAGSIGGSSKAPENRNGVAVYTTNRNQQVIYTWFEDKFMQVLIIREDETIEGAGTGVNTELLIAQAIALEPVPLEAV